MSLACNIVRRRKYYLVRGRAKSLQPARPAFGGARGAACTKLHVNYGPLSQAHRLPKISSFETSRPRVINGDSSHCHSALHKRLFKDETGSVTFGYGGSIFVSPSVSNHNSVLLQQRGLTSHCSELNQSSNATAGITQLVPSDIRTPTPSIRSRASARSPHNEET